MTRRRNSGDNLESRVTRVETALTSASSQITELGADLHALQARIETGFENIRSSIYSARQPNWSVLVAAGAFILTLAMLALATIGGLRGESAARFAEVETQFRGVSKEIQTQVDNNKERAVEIANRTDTIHKDTDALKERVSKTEQKLNDHDTYLWPIIQKNENTNDNNR